MLRRVKHGLLRYWVWITILLVVSAGGYWYWQSTQQKKNGIKTIVASIRDIRKTVSASGKITAEKQVTLRFQTAGSLSWVGVKKGDRVKKWQAIASLNQQQLEKQFKQEMLDYMTSRWDFEQQSDDYNIRGRRIEDAGLTAEKKRIFQKTQFTLDRSVLDVEIVDLAKRYAVLVTPIDGIVIKATDEYAGINISPAITEYTIADPDSLRFSADVEELDIGTINASKAATITLDAFPEEEISSRVSSIEFTAVETISGATAYTVHFPLVPDPRLLLDMNGEAEIFVEEKNEVLTLPVEAVETTKTGKQVTRLTPEKKQEKVEVTTGLESDEYIEITSGLVSGDTIILK